MSNTETEKNIIQGNSIPTSIAPWLTVQDGRKAVAFYKSAFGAIEVYRLEAPNGALVARLSVDGAEFWVSGESQEHSDPGTASLREGSVRMILTVTNPDPVFARTLEAGASEVFPVGEGHGWRLGRLVDPFGLHWEIGHPIT